MLLETLLFLFPEAGEEVVLMILCCVARAVKAEAVQPDYREGMARTTLKAPTRELGCSKGPSAPRREKVDEG